MARLSKEIDQIVGRIERGNSFIIASGKNILVKQSTKGCKDIANVSYNVIYFRKSVSQRKQRFLKTENGDEPEKGCDESLVPKTSCILCIKGKKSRQIWKTCSKNIFRQ